MAMYFTDYSSTQDSSIRPARYHKEDEQHITIERTEDNPDMIEGQEMKKKHREVGGNPYMKSGGILQAEEFVILGDDIGETIALKNYKGVPGLYRIREDGHHTKLI
jgi:hypothetical protein